MGTLCLSVILPCEDFMYVTMGDYRSLCLQVGPLAQNQPHVHNGMTILYFKETFKMFLTLFMTVLDSEHQYMWNKGNATNHKNYILMINS